MGPEQHTANEAPEEPDCPFARVSTAYSNAFRSRDHDGLHRAFHPEATVRVHDRRSNERLELTPDEFFRRLYVEIGDAEFQVETLKKRFTDGSLFADGTCTVVWTDPSAG